MKTYIQFWYCSACNTAIETRCLHSFLKQHNCDECGVLAEKALSSTAISGRVIVDLTN